MLAVVENQYWNCFAKNSNISARNELISYYQPYVKSIAAKFFRNNSYPSIEFEDYLSYANLGLIKAIERYEVEQNVPFKTFAYQAIRGAIMDGIFKFTEASNIHSSHRKREMARLRTLLTKNSDGRDDFEFGEIVEITAALSIGFLLESNVHDELEDVSIDTDPYNQQVQYSIGKRLSELVGTLSKNKQTVVRLHYFSQLPFKEIAELMNCTPARISQLHKESLQQLLQRLQIENFSLEL